MSHLKLYCPDEEVETPVAVEADSGPLSEHPGILRFEDWARWLRQDGQYDVIQRARRIHKNLKCPACSTATVTVFGNATQLAFECGRCSHNWSA